MNTLLVPNAGNFAQTVEYVATVVKGNCGNLRSATRKYELTLLQRMMKAPFSAKALKLR